MTAPARPLTDQFDIESALTELKEKSHAEIEKEAAYRWTSRSLAASQLYKETGGREWDLLQADFGHEGMEHAAVVEDDGATLKIVETALKKARSDSYGA